MATAESHRFAPRAPEAQAVDRMLQCIAGFYEDESQARQALLELRDVHHLSSSQVLLMGPRDASPARFAWRSRQWAGRWSTEGRQHAGDLGMSALLGALLAGVVAVLLLVLEFGAPVAMSPRWWRPAGWLVAAVLAGAAVGAGSVALADGTQRPRQFDGNVKRQLAAGRWAVVAHGMPMGRQAGVLSLLRASGRHWSAVAKSMQRL